MSARNDMVNAGLISAGLAPVAVAPAKERVTVDLLTPFTKDAKERLVGEDMRVIAMREALAQLEAEVAREAVQDIYAMSVMVTKYSTSANGERVGTKIKMDVVEAASYATELIGIRAMLRDDYKVDFDTDENFAYLRTELEGIKVFLKNLGFNTSYGASGIYAIKRTR